MSQVRLRSSAPELPKRSSRGSSQLHDRNAKNDVRESHQDDFALVISPSGSVTPIPVDVGETDPVAHNASAMLYAPLRAVRRRLLLAVTPAGSYANCRLARLGRHGRRARLPPGRRMNGSRWSARVRRRWVAAAVVATGWCTLGAPTALGASATTPIPLIATLSGDPSPVLQVQTCVDVHLTDTSGNPVQASGISIDMGATVTGTPGIIKNLPFASTDATGNGSICFSYALPAPNSVSFTLDISSGQTVDLPGGGFGEISTSNTITQTPVFPKASLPTVLTASTSTLEVGVPFTLTAALSDGNIIATNLGVELESFEPQFSMKSRPPRSAPAPPPSSARPTTVLSAFNPGDTATITLQLTPLTAGGFSFSTVTTGDSGPRHVTHRNRRPRAHTHPHRRLHHRQHDHEP